MAFSVLSLASLAVLAAAEEVAWSGFDRWSFNSYSELGTKQAHSLPWFMKNNVGTTASCKKMSTN